MVPRRTFAQMLRPGRARRKSRKPLHVSPSSASWVSGSSYEDTQPCRVGDER
jgi:hypothetical protein